MHCDAYRRVNGDALFFFGAHSLAKALLSHLLSRFHMHNGILHELIVRTASLGLLNIMESNRMYYLKES